MQRTKRGKSHEKISRLMSAAALEFARVGLQAASLETIALQARVSRQLIYNKFGGKRGLYAAVQSAARSTLFDTLTARASTQPTPLSAVSDVLEGLFDGYMASALLRRNFADNGFPRGAENPEDKWHPIYKMIEACLSRGMLSGEIKRQWSGQAFFDTAASLIAGVTAMRTGAEEARDFTINFIVRALKAEGNYVQKLPELRPKTAPKADGTSAERIISAAEAQFARFGVEASSISAIASRGGVSKQLIYYHFKNKETLHKTVQDRLLDRVLPRFEALDLESLEPIAAVRAYVATYEQVQMAYPNSMKLDLNNRLQRGHVAVGDAAGRARSANFLRRFEDVIIRGRADGSIHGSMTAALLFNVSAIIFCSRTASRPQAQSLPIADSSAEFDEHSIAQEFIVCGSTG